MGEKRRRRRENESSMGDNKEIRGKNIQTNKGESIKE